MSEESGNTNAFPHLNKGTLVIVILLNKIVYNSPQKASRHLNKNKILIFNHLYKTTFPTFIF